MTKLFTVAALATIIIGGDAFALPAVQSTYGVKASSGHSSGMHGRGHGRFHGVGVHGFDQRVETPLDLASGHSSGKRQHKPVVLESGKGHGRGARDPASGLPTGQRMH